jgi:3-oxoacyl-[acyl-carrier-protein] synthase III
MRIDAVKAAFPSRVLDNQQIIDLVRHHSQDIYTGDLEAGLATIDKLLRISGARTRRWLGDGETPLALIQAAVTDALTEARIAPDDIDLLIYVGIGKGFAEPGQSYLLAQSLGLDHVECFDILDACMSFTRAMQIADAFLKTRQYRRILIANGEINTFEGGPLYPVNYRLPNAAALEYTLASYTIGGAATATLVSADNDKPWTFRYRSRPDLADLCTVPTVGAPIFAQPSDRIGRNGTHNFTSYGKDLHDNAFEPCVGLMRTLLAEHADIKRIFVHTSSFREWDKFARALGVEDRVHHLYPDHGNLVSASIPAGIATALDAGLVHRGDRVAGWVGSAGMSFAAYSFTY